MLRYSALLLAMLLSVGRASWADELLESWRCFDRFDFDKTELLLTLARYQGEWSEYGVVTLSGVEPITTLFGIKGFKRRWDWDQYAVIVEPNGDGHYYDFSTTPDGETIPASMSFQCKKVSTTAPQALPKT